MLGVRANFSLVGAGGAQDLTAVAGACLVVDQFHQRGVAAIARPCRR
jgi:hypothetical protein